MTWVSGLCRHGEGCRPVFLDSIEELSHDIIHQLWVVEHGAVARPRKQRPPGLLQVLREDVDDGRPHR
eukprot:CAMPEP_0195031844 /NCGR_PEP_ID=MMETSP0326_2-20130528/62174_1 /TAXON_ID=2866 ORGANISM="Crypthecodinium cohnii, Strain Seligo" /NCGR_SAMPLE_ID=MMETSP0326_2 /ASSEMBLY_ACC=CAM_ASM_000348 /LENGTH=67 /DNA_ID=CAMNT_0040055731 /DNA_START=558 /DNA_END=758 /DNA_ORIENTATION=-